MRAVSQPSTPASSTMEKTSIKAPISAGKLTSVKLKSLSSSKPKTTILTKAKTLQTGEAEKYHAMVADTHVEGVLNSLPNVDTISSAVVDPVLQDHENFEQGRIALDKLAVKLDLAVDDFYVVRLE